MRRKLSIVVSLIITLTFLLTACSNPAGNTGSSSPQGGSNTGGKTKLVTSDYFDPPPAIQGNPWAPSNTQGMNEFIFDRLFEYVPAPKETYYPMLAEKYENQGAKTIITLKKDIKWNDGKPFTSKDVLCTYYLGYLAGWPMWQYANSIEAPDDYTVAVNWKKEGAILAQMAFANFIQAPYHIYGKWADQVAPFTSKRDQNGKLSKEDQEQVDKIKQDLFKFKPDPKTVVGTGPYKIVNVTASEGVLEKNSNYREPDKIKIDQVVVQRYVSQEAYLSTVMSKGYDMEPHGLAPDVFTQIQQKNPDMKIIWTADLGQPSMQFNTAKYPVNIPQVRKAIMCAINREELSKVVEPGTEKPDTYATGMSPVFIQKWLPDSFMQGLKNYNYNVDNAAKYLESIGWKKGSDGFYKNEKGEPVQIEIASMNSWPIYFLGGQNITEQLNKFGLKTVFKPMELSAYWQYLDNGEAMVSFDFRGNCQQYGFPWEAYRSLFIDSGNRIGLKTQVGQKPGDNSNAANQDVILNPDGTKTFKDGLGHIIVKTSDGQEIDVNKNLDDLFYATNKNDQVKITQELAKAANEAAVLMAIGEKYAPMKVYNQKLTGYSLDKTAPENYSYGMRVIGKMVKLGILKYQ